MKVACALEGVMVEWLGLAGAVVSLVLGMCRLTRGWIVEGYHHGHSAVCKAAGVDLVARSAHTLGDAC